MNSVNDKDTGNLYTRLDRDADLNEMERVTINFMFLKKF